MAPFFALVLLFAAASADQSGCSQGQTKIGNACYRVSNQKETWVSMDITFYLMSMVFHAKADTAWFSKPLLISVEEVFLGCKCPLLATVGQDKNWLFE